MWRYSHNLQSLYETPALPANNSQTIDRDTVAALVAATRTTGRTLLSEAESKQILAAYGLPVVETEVTTSADEAVVIAQRIGFLVVRKLASTTITHKSDIGGVKLDLRTPAMVRRAYRAIRAATMRAAGAEQFQGVSVQPMIKREGYELILGMSCDPQFGPVLRRLLQIARDEQIARVVGYVLPENGPMLRLCRRVGFRLVHRQDYVEAVVIQEVNEQT